MAEFDLKDHLRREHAITPVSTYLREIVYGGNDGIVTTFAVVAGFAGAQQDPASSPIPLVSVLLFGLANLFADGLSMGLGSFLSLRADQDVYKNAKSKEHHEIMTEPKSEFDETVGILKHKGFSAQDATSLATIYRKNTAYWTEFMMRDELEMSNPEKEKPHLVALSTFFSFILFGAIPLVPYMLFQRGEHVFPISVVFTAVALLLLGLLRAVVTQRKMIRGILETVLVGGISASVAYLVGSFFRMSRSYAEFGLTFLPPYVSMDLWHQSLRWFFCGSLLRCFCWL